MKHLFFFACFLLFLSMHAQEVMLDKLILINGGKFGDPTDNVNVQILDPTDNSTQPIDTIQTGSAQDLLLDGTVLYVAAQDSIVAYDLQSGTRMAAIAFGAPSTIHMELAGEYLLVGNWYEPFGQIGSFLNHFRVFDRNTLAFVDSIPEIRHPAQDFVVLGEEVYVTQNLTSSAFADSAGWLAKVDLNTLTVVDSISVNANQEDLGRLILLDSVIYGLNGISNTVTSYDLRSGIASTDTANADIQPNTYGSRLSVDERGLVYTIVDGKIASYDLASRSVLNPAIVDTVITAFAHDTINERFYVTQTDFFSYTQGRIYDESGARVGSFKTGSAPEVIEVLYKTASASLSDLNLRTSVNIFPNPTQGIVSIEFELSWTGSIELLDLSGKRWHMQQVSRLPKLCLNLSDLPEGIYLIRGQNETEFWNHRLIKLP